jgi:DNA-directed RNA polymerase specialized sigma subunit
MNADPEKVPSRRQIELLRSVAALEARLGHRVTLQEMAEALGQSRAGPRAALLQCEKKGLLSFAVDERRGPMKFPRVTVAVLDTLTVRQREVYDLALSLKRRLGHAPTIAEVNQDLGMSNFGVHSTLLELEAKGAIGFAASERRGPIEITKEGKQWL